ncbi:cysteine desulfurase [Prolixibacteraceae bacterium JC049]|nr:cysteine desulfurase [Prolixibacteraceae bacterium JC049]
MNDPIYLDYAASTPVDKDVLRELLPYFTELYANPSNSINSAGQKAFDAVKKSEQQIQEALNTSDYNVIFTSGATESINTCLKSLYTQFGFKKHQIITCKTEHKAVLSVCEYLEQMGAEIIYLPVDKNGNVSLEDLKKSISEKTLAVSLMYVNNETGVIHDIQAISEICQISNVSFVCDATQAVGKLPLDLNDTSIDYLIFSGHKIYAPKGIGVLLINKKAKQLPLIHGGGQQNNLRSGTLNVPGIVALGKAVEKSCKEAPLEYTRTRILRDQFETALAKTGKIKIIAEQANRSPYISNIQFLFNDSEEIILPLRDKIFFSTGSACTSAIVEPSHVLTAMDIENHLAEKCLRFSFGAPTTQEEIATTINHFINIL